MKATEAFNKLHDLERSCPEIRVKVVSVDDVLAANDWLDTRANRQHVLDSWEWRKGWNQMGESDWAQFSMMENAPDAGSYDDGPDDKEIVL